MASNSVSKQENCASHTIEMILQKVKLKLSSRELTEQKDALNWLINELNVNSKVGLDLLIAMLLKSEIIALLCDTTMTTTMEGPLVTSTLECLASLTNSEQFYRQNHASYVVASILRSGHFLTLVRDETTKDELVMLESIARTLEKIFEGATSFQVSTNEICESEQILTFFNKLLNIESQTYRIVFSAAKVLSIVLRSINTTRAGELIVTVVGTTLDQMRLIIEAKNPNDGKYAFRAMVMTCAVSAAGIPSCVQTNNVDADDLGSTNLVNCIYSSMMRAVIPNFNKIEPDEINGQFYKWFVACLNGLYDINHCNSIDLSNYLAEEGFLQTLPRLSTLLTENLRSETLSLISRILTTLATVSLSAETWLGGAKQFRNFLFNAFISLPEDPASWLPILSKGDNRADALLVLFYYNFLGESISNGAPYLSLIVDYVMSSASLKTKRKSVTIRKALWFTFSFAAASHEEPSKVGSYETAMNRLFKYLESSDLTQCYTHHPALVVHCLRTISISDKLRATIICLWLNNGGDVRCLVDATVEGNLANYYCLLETVRTGSPETVDVVIKGVSELIKNHEAVEALEIIAWEILQQILAPGYKGEEYNTISVLKLATMFEPKQIPGTLVRTLYHLISFILENESDTALISLGIKAAYCLLSLSIKRNDVTGVTMFTNKPRLVQILKTLAFARNDPALSCTCFDCLSTLVRYQANYSIQCEDPLEIDSEDLLKQLYFDECLGALNLVRALFTSQIERPVIVVNDIFSSGTKCDDVIIDIYLQIHMIHSRSGREGRNLCYSSLVGLLNHCSTVKNLPVLKILCQFEWTFILIEITIEGKQGDEPNFMNFVTEWLTHRYSVLPLSAAFGERSICRDQFEMTLDCLGKNALKSFETLSNEESLKELIQNLMLFQEHLSPRIAAELREADRQLTKN